MKNVFENKGSWLIALAVVILLVIIGHFFLVNKPTDQYHKIVDQSGLINKLNGDSLVALKKDAKSNNLKYQVYSQSKLTATNDPTLPELMIDQQAAVLAHVIISPSNVNLSSMVPYQTWINHHLYIYFALSHSTSPPVVYVVYSKVF